MNIINGIKKFIKSFRYAFSGVLYAIKTQRNFRFHICAAFYVVLFMQFYDLSASKRAVIYVVIALVMSLELLNTAVEAVTDLSCSEYNILAKTAKDTAAGAVLIVSCAAVAVGICFFWDIDVFKNIISFFADNYFAAAGLIASIIICIFFIFSSFDKKTKQQ